MASPDASRLRLLAAELRAEVERLEKTVAEIVAAREEVLAAGASRLTLYGAAALLETFYTGFEKALTRVASAFGLAPQGPSWHRALLEDAALDLVKVRPPVISPETGTRLDRYLAFRHRFRNLYLFDLDSSLLSPLLADLPGTWCGAQRDLLGFAEFLERLADELEDPKG
jgi:hypothetical protein